MRKEPFIAGVTDNGITVAPLSERYRFVEAGGVRVQRDITRGACQTRSRPGPPRWTDSHRARHPDVTFASDLRSVVVKNPVIRLRGAMA